MDTVTDDTRSIAVIGIVLEAHMPHGKIDIAWPVFEEDHVCFRRGSEEIDKLITIDYATAEILLSDPENAWGPNPCKPGDSRRYFLQRNRGTYLDSFCGECVLVGSVGNLYQTRDGIISWRGIREHRCEEIHCHCRHLAADRDFVITFGGVHTVLRQDCVCEVTYEQASRILEETRRYLRAWDEARVTTLKILSGRK